MRSLPILFAGLAAQLASAYQLVDDYGSGNGFFDKFNFFTVRFPRPMINCSFNH